MRKSWGTWMAGVLISAIALSIAACGASSGGTVADDSGGKTIKVLLSEEPGSEDNFGKMLNAWAEETGNKIETIVISHDDQLSKFPAMAKNKDLPDLVWTTRLHQLYPEEFVDMSTVVDTGIIDTSALKIVGKDYKSDKISGLPVQFTTTAMFYNKDAFAATGLTAPDIKNPWTWEEVYENAAKLQESGNVKYGLAADVSRARYDIMMYANGGSMVISDGAAFKVAINSEENIKTLESFIKINEEGVMPKAIWAGGTTDNPVEYFKNGDAGMLLSGSWNYNTFAADLTKFEFGVMPTPKGEVSQAAIIGGAALAVPEDAKNKDVAIEFLQWLYTKENFTTFLEGDKGLSALNAVIYQPEDEKAATDFLILQNEASLVSDTFMVDESSAWRTYKDNEYRDYIKRAVSGEMTAKEALDAFAKELSEGSGWEIAKP